MKYMNIGGGSGSILGQRATVLSLQTLQSQYMLLSGRTSTLIYQQKSISLYIGNIHHILDRIE